MTSPFLETNAEAIRAGIVSRLRYVLAKTPDQASPEDIYTALAFTVRDRLIDRMIETEIRYRQSRAKRVYYLSMEYLIGQSLGKNLYTLGMYETCRRLLPEFGVELEEVEDVEADAALGNGGLGRLAACYLDSLATLDMPGFGYGIHYDYGIFRQEIHDGYQREKPDHWVHSAEPLHVERTGREVLVPLYGKIEHAQDRWGGYNPMWMDWSVVIGVPYDIPIAGFGARTVNYLRLFMARPSKDFDIRIFNQGDYIKAVEKKLETEKISKILYPNDVLRSGKELRLTQEYFLVACSLRDIIRDFTQANGDLTHLPDRVAIQMNDTHPSLAVAELMRILVDEHWMEWEPAWKITKNTLAYTNHTLLPEALEKWPASLLETVIPRHLQIIYEINERFLTRVAEIWPGDTDRQARMSLIEEGKEKQVRMAHLAIAGSHSINGVSELHTELLKTRLLPDFNAMWPERFRAVTNGITPRRWLLKANPGLADLLGEEIGRRFIKDLDRLENIERLVDDTGFLDAFAAVKRQNKFLLSRTIEEDTLVEVDPESMFDIQAKRIHEYKRQLLNVLAIIAEYLAIVEDGRTPARPKTAIFAGKAAPGYTTAKNIIKLIHSVMDVVNRDQRAEEWLKVVFLPDYRVSLAEKIVAAADLSQQISTAGYEASGTGNMKFALNGALTIGTLDGANIEIRDAVGEENLFIFGLTAEEIAGLVKKGSYRPARLREKNPLLDRALDALSDNRFCPRSPGLFDWVVKYLENERDPYFHLADFDSYCQARARADELFGNPRAWVKKTLVTVARMGRFSSDRAIRQYAEEIWGVKPVP